MANESTVLKDRTEIKVSEPSKYKVIYCNDDVTTAEFVMVSLIDIFAYSVDDAEQKTMEIHHNDKAMVAVLPYEIAEQKATEVIYAAKSAGFPLVVFIEPE